MRDEQMKAGTYDSGLPEWYESWAFENLKEFVKIPISKKRIEEHLSQLDLSISNREKILNNLNHEKSIGTSEAKAGM